MSFLLNITTEPVAKERPRLGMNGGKPRIYTPTKTAYAQWQIRQAFTTKYPLWEPLKGALSVMVIAYLRLPKSIPLKRRASAMPTSKPDVDNLLKLALDALKGVAWVDDAQICQVTVIKAYIEGAANWSISCEELWP